MCVHTCLVVTSFQLCVASVVVSQTPQRLTSLRSLHALIGSLPMALISCQCPESCVTTSSRGVPLTLAPLLGTVFLDQRVYYLITVKGRSNFGQSHHSFIVVQVRGWSGTPRLSRQPESWTLEDLVDQIRIVFFSFCICFALYIALGHRRL